MDFHHFNAGLALRVSLAVTWLTVYRQLHISVLPESNTGEGRICPATHP